MKVGIVMEHDFLFLKGTQQAFTIPIFSSLTDRGHADLDPQSLQRLDIGGGGILHPLVGVMHVGLLPYQRTSYGRQRERLVELTAQMPAANTPGIHVHQHGQVHILLAHTDVGDIADPYLIRANDRQSVHQIAVSRTGMVAVGRARVPYGALPLEPHLAHEARDVFTADLDLLTVQESRDAPLAIGRPYAREALDRGLEGRLVPALSAVIVAAPRALEHLAELAYGLVLAEHLHYLPRLFARGCKRLVAFFRMSFSSVKRPAKRSNSATRVASW
jgi:hypothetical protein